VKRVIAPLALLLGALSAAAPGRAQIGELQAGVVGSYGWSAAYGPGGGLVLGVATGRLAYVGMRWTYHAGSTTAGVTTRVQTFTVDLGVVIPVGHVDVVAGLGLGAARFAQRAGSARAHKVEFLGAPGLAAELHLGPVALIPELQYSLAGDPQLPQQVRHHGLVATVKLVIPIEVGRIRR
jgi:hypothetical protein